MKTLLLCLAFITIFIGIPGQVYATSLTVNFDSGMTSWAIPGVRDNANGGSMAGMNVTFYWQDSAGFSRVDTGTWTGSGDDGGVSLSFGVVQFSLSESGDTFSGIWTLSKVATSSHITRILIDAFPANTVFDTYFNAGVGTSGSGLGSNFQMVSATGLVGDIVATYRDLVNVDGNAPVGDLYRYLDIAFPDSVGFRSGTLEFTADTDPISNVPSPGTILLLGSGLIGLALFGKILR